MLPHAEDEEQNKVSLSDKETFTVAEAVASK
jgi:hypothetical protein